MTKFFRANGRLWIPLLGVVVVCALTGGVWVRMGLPSRGATSGRPLPNPATADPALEYVRALQSGDCERVISMTRWMQQRLAYVQATAGDADEARDVREELCAELQDRPVEAGFLSPEGIEDKFVFPPGAIIEVVGRDEGRTDLDVAVAHRTWVHVTYPVARYAPRGEDGRSVQTMTVGVNVSAEGTVVKAGVVGNVEVDEHSLRYRMPETGGE